MKSINTTLFNTSAHTILMKGLSAMTKACDAQEHLIEVIGKELADSKLRCDELVARNAQLEERHVLNQN